MNISELAAIAAVELYGGFASAAEHTNTPLATLSKRISRAESELGFAVFERKTAVASVSLTEQGGELIPLIHTLLSANNSMFNTVQNLLGKNAYTLILGRPPLLGDIGDISLISSFMAENLDTELVSVVRSHAELMRLLMECQLECAFFLLIGAAVEKRRMTQMFRAEQYDFSVIRKGAEMYIGISEDDALASGESVSMAQLREHTFIFNKWQDGLGVKYGRGPSFFDYAGENKKDYKLAFEDFMNRDYIYRLVAAGGRVVPQVFPDKYKTPGIKFLRLEGWKQESFVVFVSRKYGSGALRKFAEYVSRGAGSVKNCEALFEKQE